MLIIVIIIIIITINPCTKNTNELQGSAGVAAIGAALACNTHLRHLSLGANYTNEEYIKPVAVQV